MDRSRGPTRVLVLLGVALALLEAATVGLVVQRAGAEIRPDRGGQAHLSVGSANPTSAARRFVRPAPPAPDRVQPLRHLLVRIPRDMELTARPGGGRVVGTVPAGSPHYSTPTVAWILKVSEDGRFGRVALPYSARRGTGWLRLRGLRTTETALTVIADLSEHEIVVERGDRVLFRAPAATGSPISPTPPGRYFVSDRVPFAPGSYLGTFAFGLSGIQPNLPPGWSGGNQLAIHGTTDPGSIGRSASAGCLRVSERVLDRLRPLLRIGTPVIVRP